VTDLVAPAVSVVLPTYNEVESLPVIVPRIVGTLREAGIACEVIVVDDDSPDGTADAAERLSGELPVRVVRRREERGLATAVLRGFAEAQAPICIVLDADGSHPISALPAMVRMIEDDKADIVVGSRNIKGGGSHNWPLFSQLKSKLAAALTFGLTSMTDPTTGLMAVRKSLLPGLALDPVGWKIVLEIVVKAAPARVAEVPIVFEDRELGQSKQSLRVFLQYALHLASLYAFRYPALAELAKFCAVGVVGLVVDLSTVIAIKELTALDTRLCAVFGFAVAVTTNFALNRRFTFAHGRDLPWLFSYLTYVGTNMLGLSVRVAVVYALMAFADLDRGHGYVLSNAAGIALATVFNFAGAKFFAFDPERLSFGRAAAAEERAPEPALGRGTRYAALALACLALIYAAATSTVTREITTGDEGVNITMARNIAESTQLLVRPSVYPGGRRDWLAEDLPALGNTPFFPALLSPLAARGSLVAMGLLPLLAWCVTVLFTALAAWQQSPRAGLYTGVLLATSPAFLAQSLSLEFEPVLTAFCAAGLYLFVRGTRARAPGVCFAGGALLGAGFLTKMWLVVPYASAACAFVLVQATFLRAREELPLLLRRSVAAAALGFAITATAHLVFVAATSPGDLRHWVGAVYLGIFSGHGVTGDKLSALGRYTDKPFWFYPARLYRDHFYLLPLALFGLPALLRRGRGHALGALAMAFGACVGVIVLSVPAVKEPLYVLSVAPLLYMLAGVSLAELESDSQKHRPANAAVVQAACGVALVSVLCVWIAHVLARSPATALYAWSHAAGMLACCVAGAAFVARRPLTTAVLTCCALAVCALAAADYAQPPDRSRRALANALQPWLQDAEPAYPSFAAPDAQILTGYLQRTGRDWPDREPLPEGAALRAFVLSPARLAQPRGAGLAHALSARMHEVAVPEAPGYRVFVAAPR
jgi:dolichol-phosphate mannosyltransferase